MIDIHDFGRRKFPRADLLLSSEGRGWRGVAAELRRHPPGEILAPTPDQMEITLATTDCEGARVQRRGNGRYQDTAVKAGTLWTCPIGVPEDAVRILGHLDRILHIFVSRDVFLDISRSSSAAMRPEDVPYEADIDDPFLRMIAQRIGTELLDESSAGAVLVESLSLSLGAHLASRYTSTKLTDHAHVGSLESRRLRRVLDFIADNIDKDITLSHLAAVACLSRHHFARAFRHALGSPPNRFISELRLKRAQELLVLTELSLAEIAHSCRFSSQSTFTRAFRRQAGISPGEFRSRRRAGLSRRAHP